MCRIVLGKCGLGCLHFFELLLDRHVVLDEHGLESLVVLEGREHLLVHVRGWCAGGANAGDLLVDGAFNVNSTSVEAWISQLTSLKEMGAAKTYFPRTFTEPVNKDDLLAGWASLTDEQVALVIPGQAGAEDEAGP